MLGLTFSCQQEVVTNNPTPTSSILPNNPTPSISSNSNTNTSNNAPVINSTPKPAIDVTKKDEAKPSVKPTATPTPPPKLKDETDIDEKLDPNDKDEVKTDTEVLKTNINWKEYNPILKGKKYTYIYTIKEGDTSIPTEVIREVVDIRESTYILRQSLAVANKESQFPATNISVALNSDNSPTIIPAIAVGGEKVTPTSTIQVFEKPEKVKVPLAEYDAVKVISTTTDKTGAVKTTSWYDKNIGLVRSTQESKAGIYYLELKDFK